jgi:hypothetical protein
MVVSMMVQERASSSKHYSQVDGLLPRILCIIFESLIRGKNESTLSR